MEQQHKRIDLLNGKPDFLKKFKKYILEMCSLSKQLNLAYNCPIYQLFKFNKEKLYNS